MKYNWRRLYIGDGYEWPTPKQARVARLRRRLQLDSEGPRDPLQIVGEGREFRSARIAPAPGEANRARLGGGRQGRVHNRIRRSDGEGQDDGAALTSSDHVLQIFGAPALAIPGAPGRCRPQRPSP